MSLDVRGTRPRGLENQPGDKENQPNANPAAGNQQGDVQTAKPPPGVKPSPARRSADPEAKAPEEPETYETIEERVNGEVVRRYLKGKLLGKGGFAKAYWATCLSTQKQYAMKVVLKSTLTKPKAKAKLQVEVKIHSTLRHQHIVRFHHFFEDDVAYYLLLELAHNKSFSELMKKRKRLTEPEVQLYMLQILEALEYMHGIGVIHRDLKLGNLLLDKDMRVKIGDLGLAARVMEPGERKRTLCGTPNYIAPEILENKHGHSFEVDIWSTGVVLYTMLVGRPPYESKDVKATYKRILANNFTFPDHVVLSEESKDLISSMLQTDPSKRPSIPTIAAHPFFTRKGAVPPKSIPQSALVTPPIFAQPLAKAQQQPVAQPAAPLPVFVPAEAAPVVSAPLAVQPVAEDDATMPRTSGATRRTPADTRDTRSQNGAAASSVRPTTSEQTRPAAVANDMLVQRVTAAAAAARSRGQSSRDGARDGAREGGSPRSADLTPQAAQSSASVAQAAAQSSREGQRRSRSASRTRPPPHAVAVSASSSAVAPASVLSEALDTHHTAGIAKEAASFRPPITKPQGVAPREVSRDSSEGRAAPPQRPRSSSRTRNDRTAEQPKRATATVDEASPRECDTAASGMATTGGGEMGTLESIHHNLSAVMAAIERGDKGSKGFASSLGVSSVMTMSGRRLALGPRQWVTQYVDYTSKYGLGYLLSDGSTGVYFNDSTKIVLGPGPAKAFQYMERVRSKEEGHGADSHERFEAHTLDSYPPALHKKVTLLQHFRDYLLTQQKDKDAAAERGLKGDKDLDSAFGVNTGGGQTAGVPEPRAAWGEKGDGKGDEPLVFVKKWVRTRHAILFRMSNHTVQVMFLDNTEVLLSSEARVVTFADKHGQRKTMSLAEVMEAPRSDITKRLKYTKDILRQLITSGKK